MDVKIIYLIPVSDRPTSKVHTKIATLPLDLVSPREFIRSKQRELLILILAVTASRDLKLRSLATGDIETLITKDAPLPTLKSESLIV